jgi:hypothetical protein
VSVESGAAVVPLTRATCELTDRQAVTSAVRAAAPDVVVQLAAARHRASGGERTDRPRSTPSPAHGWSRRCPTAAGRPSRWR